MAPVMQRAERPGVGDGERAAADVVETQPLVAGPVGHVADPAGHAPQVELLGVVHDRDDEPFVVEVDGDPQVDVVVDDQRVVAHRGVEVGEVGQGLDRGPGGEGQVGEAEPLLGPEAIAVGPTDLLDPLVVDLLDHQRVGRGGLGPDHVLGGAAPDVGEGDDLVPVGEPGAPDRRRGRTGRRTGAGRRTRPRCSAPGPARRRVRPGRDRPAMTASTSLRVIRPPSPVPVTVSRVDAVLVEQLAHHRREHQAVSGLGRRRGRPVLGGGRGRRVPVCSDAGSRRRGRGGSPAPAGWPAAVAAGAAGAGGSARPEPAGLAGAAAARALPLAEALVADDRQRDADVDGVALLHQDGGQHPLGRRRHLRVDLVGRHLEQRLVPGHLVARPPCTTW